jgi:enamine deaminase RidA (YjgF/YER057c/UK114 family)
MKAMKTVEHINPEGLMRNPAFTQVISVAGPARTIYVGGQNAVDASRNIVGRGDLREQARQAVQNLRVALEGAGAGLEHLVACTIHLVQGQPLQPAFEAWMSAWGARPNPPTVTVLFVAGLANPEFLIEIDAVAVVPDAKEG